MLSSAGRPECHDEWTYIKEDQTVLTCVCNWFQDKICLSAFRELFMCQKAYPRIIAVVTDYI